MFTSSDHEYSFIDFALGPSASENTIKKYIFLKSFFTSGLTEIYCKWFVLDGKIVTENYMTFSLQKGTKEERQEKKSNFLMFLGFAVIQTSQCFTLPTCLY